MIPCKRLERGWLQIVDEYTAVITSDEKIAVDIVDSQYPDYRRVIPSEDVQLAKEYVIFDPDLLKIVNKFIGCKHKVPLMENSLAPAMWISDDDGCERKAILMPIRY